MPFSWEYLGADGQAIGRSPRFASRGGAEEWLGEEWQDLLARGVEEVELRDEGRSRVLYRMRLREA